MLAIDLGAFPVTLRNRRPALPHNMMASGMLGINHFPLAGEGSVVRRLRLIEDDMASLA